MGGRMPQPLPTARLTIGATASRRTRRSYLFALVLAAVFLQGSGFSQSAAEKLAKSFTGGGAPKAVAPAPAPTPAPSNSAEAAATPIPLPDVAARSEDLNRMLRDVGYQLPAPEQLDAIKVTLAERDEELKGKLKEVDALLAGAPSSLEIREEENYWKETEKDTAASRKALLDWANSAQAAIQQLQAQKPQWDATLEANESTPDLGPTLDVIQQAVSEIGKLQTQAQNQLRLIVNLQIRAASQDQLALDVIDRLDKSLTHLEGRLFERDSLPLWELSQRRQIGENTEFYLASTDRLRTIQTFARESRGAIGFLLILFVLTLFGTYRLYLLTRDKTTDDECVAKVVRITRHWIALGILPPLLLGYLLAPLAPLPLIGLGILVSLVPVIILLPPLIGPKYRTLLYGLFGVYVLNAVVGWFSLSAIHKREVQFIINLLVFAVFAVLVRPRQTVLIQNATRGLRLRIFGMRLAVLLIGISLTANLFGYVKLAQFLGYLAFYSTFIAISILASLKVYTLLLLVGIDAPIAQQLAAVRLHRDAIARWVPRLMQWIGAFIWLTATLDLMGMRDEVTGWFLSILNFHIAGGSSGITFGGVIGFFVILLAGYAISSGIRFLLREELLSRFHLSRGLPELIASTMHYLLLLLVFFFAVNAGGVELNKFTVLTGALGVGVGFGLQNIVNNFISGLILQFERPIHIGDVLDVDGTTGKVTRIGIRSSTVLTFQGAEVIIPNGNFISGKVINWTLSASLRRAELPVGVAYGSDPKVVSRLLEQAATMHESVLTSPAPAVFFKEFADSSLNFELQFWVMQESNVVKVKSEVALTAMESFNEAGIEIPYPQRDLRLRAVDASAAAMLQPLESFRNVAAENGKGRSESEVASNPLPSTTAER